ncbi:MAG: TetR/AcrR family transcriptional regulator [Ruminococcaceae bacterium]|nr:TetR/AcrR family transcriptional regulator [Oscillospiraceae bacterium]
MPKQKITKEMVVNAAFELAREGGIEQITVKAIAKRLCCSVQPIYTYCASMEGLRKEVAEKAKTYVKEYTAARIDKTDPFRGTGRVHLQLAKEEPNIYKMFIFRQRENVSTLEELYREEADPQLAEAISERLNISVSKAKQLHLNMIIYTIGIGAIFSGTIPGIPAEEIFSQQEYAYQAFLNQALKEDGDNHE